MHPLASLALLVALSGSPACAAHVSLAGREAPCEAVAAGPGGGALLPAGVLSDCLGLRVERGKQPRAWEVSGYERRLKLREGSVAATVDGDPVSSAMPVQVREGRLLVPADLVEKAFGVTCTASADGAALTVQAPGAAVSDVRAGTHSDFLRVVVDLTAPAPFWTTFQPGELTVEIPPPQPLPAGWKQLRQFSFDDPLSPRVTMRTVEANWTRVTVAYGGEKKPRLLTLADPWRIVVDIPRDASLQVVDEMPGAATKPPAVPPLPELPPAAATPWQVSTFATSRGPARVFALKATPTAVRVGLGGRTIFRRARSSTIARREGACAAVNGGYFDWSGPALGLLVVEGEWIKHPIMDRAVLGITESGQARMGRLQFDGEVRMGDGSSFPLAGLNTEDAEEGEVVLFTPRWGQVLEGSETQVRLVVSCAAQVVQVEAKGGSVEIPEGGYVLSAGGVAGRKLAAAPLGAPVSVSLGTRPAWPKLRYALGAGPLLLRDGEPCVAGNEERFRDDVTGRACPRSAVGIAGDGNIVLAAAEAAEARGLTLGELATVMQKLGCREAMALDCGGSTTVVSRGLVLNRPTDGEERAVANALLVFGQPTAP